MQKKLGLIIILLIAINLFSSKPVFAYCGDEQPRIGCGGLKSCPAGSTYECCSDLSECGQPAPPVCPANSTCFYYQNPDACQSAGGANQSCTKAIGGTGNCCVPNSPPEDGGGGDPSQALINLDSLLQSLSSRGFKTNSFKDLGSIISTALPLLFGVTGFTLFLFLIFAGFKYLTSSGDPKKLEAAKGALTTAILGFVLIFTAYWITQIVNYIFNLQAGF